MGLTVISIVISVKTFSQVIKVAKENAAKTAFVIS